MIYSFLNKEVSKKLNVTADITFTKEEYNRVKEGSKTSPELKSLLAVMNHMTEDNDERNNKNMYR